MNKIDGGKLQDAFHCALFACDRKIAFGFESGFSGGYEFSDTAKGRIDVLRKAVRLAREAGLTFKVPALPRRKAEIDAFARWVVAFITEEARANEYDANTGCPLCACGRNHRDETLTGWKSLCWECEREAKRCAHEMAGGFGTWEDKVMCKHCEKWIPKSEVDCSEAEARLRAAMSDRERAAADEAHSLPFVCE